MKKKANLFLVLSVLVALYLIFGLFSIVNNASNYSPGDFIVVIIIYGLLIWLGLTFFRKYKKYDGCKHVVEEEKKEFKGKPKKPFVVLSALILILLSLGTLYVIENQEPLADKPVRVFSDATSIELEQTEKALEILEQCGIEQLDLIEHDPILDKEKTKGYRLESQGVKNIFLYISEAGDIDRVIWSDNDLYKDGEVISRITDYTLTRNEMTNLQISCQDSIKGILKSPATAKFPGIGGWRFGKNKEEVIVQSYVDAQNSFGANIRSDFQFKFQNGQITSLIFDGEEHIK